jgi:hypothetical protein
VKRERKSHVWEKDQENFSGMSSCAATMDTRKPGGFAGMTATERAMGNSLITTALELSERIKPLLAGHPPAVQGAALADLLATLIGGHLGPPELREALLNVHIESVRKLIPVCHAQALDRAV